MSVNWVKIPTAREHGTMKPDAIVWFFFFCYEIFRETRNGNDFFARRIFCVSQKMRPAKNASRKKMRPAKKCVPQKCVLQKNASRKNFAETRNRNKKKKNRNAIAHKLQLCFIYA